MRSESTVAVVIGVLACVVIIGLGCYSTYLTKEEQKTIPKWSPHDSVFPSPSWYRQCVFQVLSISTVICLCFFQITSHTHKSIFPFISGLSFTGLLIIMSWQSACSVNPFYKMKGGHNWFGYKIASITTLCLLVCEVLFMADVLTPAHWSGLMLALYSAGESICTGQYLAFCFRFLTADNIYNGGVGVFYVFFVRALFKLISRVSRLINITVFIALYYGSELSKKTMWSVITPLMITSFNIDHYFLSKRNRPNCKDGDCHGLGDYKQKRMKQWFDARYARYRAQNPYEPNKQAIASDLNRGSESSNAGSAGNTVNYTSHFEIDKKTSLIEE